MPRFNFLVICTVSIVALLCYQRVEHNPYVRYFSEALDTIHDEALEKIDRQPLFNAAVRGMTSLLDEHTGFIVRANRERYQKELDQQLSGIGIEVHLDKDKKRLIVANTIVGNPHPAADAGLRSGDQILEIAGTPVDSLPLDDAVKLIKGPTGQPVSLRVLHEGDKTPVDVSVLRRDINVDAVIGDVRDDDGKWNYLLPTKPPIAYVRITEFGGDAAAQIREVLDGLNKRGELNGLIIDVRGNPGGYLDGADRICDLFIKPGVIVTTRGRSDNITGQQDVEVHRSTGRGPYLNVPLAVLINQDSASASEIFAACLQDYHRAAIIGSRSYGKGSVQKMFPMEGGESLLKLTTAKWWRPSEVNVDRAKGAKETDVWGVHPDAEFKVPLTEEQETKRLQERQQRDAYRKGTAAGPREPFDPQLAKAVEYIEQRLKGEAAKKKDSTPAAPTTH
ncbi:MAG: S41 family peptidase [Planctomycetia bacterium]|nr:S41 family peptidase [Planctomycetia bacterium]